MSNPMPGGHFLWQKSHNKVFCISTTMAVIVRKEMKN